MERKIIDVSYHNGKIDWAKVKEHVDGAIIRCGYGSDLGKQDDKMFLENVNGCIANGIPFGVYLYSYAKTLEASKSEAAHVLRLVGPFKDKLSYPVYYDLEEKGTESGAADRAIEFGNILEENGYWCGVYANQHWWNAYLKGKLDRFTKWVAKYGANNGVPGEKPDIASTYDIWQYSSRGSIPGISGNVDVNICYRDLPGEIRGTKAENVDGVTPAPVPAPAPATPAPASAAVTYSREDFIEEVQTIVGAKVDKIAGPETLSKTVTVSKTKNRNHLIVWPLQKYFNALGYNCGEPDGIAGNLFDIAAKAFQRDHGCVIDGEITAGKGTWKSLLGLN